MITSLYRRLPSTHRAQRCFAFQNFRLVSTDAHLRSYRSGFSHHPDTAEAQGAQQCEWEWGLEPVMPVHSVHKTLRKTAIQQIREPEKELGNVPPKEL